MATEKRLIPLSKRIVYAGDVFNSLMSEKGWSATEAADFMMTFWTVDAVEVKHGRWKEICLAGGFSEEWGYVCSECGCVVSERSGLGIRHYKQNQKLNCCPNCFAMMDGDGNG